MKRLFILGILIPYFMTSQQLISENFDSYQLGFTSPDTEGSPGESGYRLLTIDGPASNTTNLGLNMSRFVEFNNSQGLQLTSPNGVQAAAYVWKDGLNTAWADRESGNDIVRVTFDLTVPFTQSKTLMGVEIYDTTLEKVLAGILINTQDLGIYGITTWQPENNDIDNHVFDLIDNNQRETYVPAQTRSYEFAFNVNTGIVTIVVNGNTYNFQSLVTGEEPYEIDFTTKVFIDSENEVAFEGVFDNLNVEALSNLSTQNTEKLSSRTVLNNNPVEANCQIKLSDNFKRGNTTVTILNMNGAVLKKLPFTSSMDVSFLKPGVYLIKLSDGKTQETLKMIKK